MITQLIELAPGTIVLSIDGLRRGIVTEPDAMAGLPGPNYCYVYWLDHYGCRLTKRPEQVDRSELLLTAHVRQSVSPQAAPQQESATQESTKAESPVLKAVPVVHVPSDRRGSLVNVVTGPKGEKNGVVLWHTLASSEEARSSVPLAELRLEGGWMPAAVESSEPSHIILDYINQLFAARPSCQPQAGQPREIKPVRVYHNASQRTGLYERDGVRPDGKVRVRWSGQATALVPIAELVVPSAADMPLARFLRLRNEDQQLTEGLSRAELLRRLQQTFNDIDELCVFLVPRGESA